ncbi:MAG: bestrophin family protein [Planctomycetes bacterium]|nr:bestrophin family protein [Planctomycetota bacterium]
MSAYDPRKWTSHLLDIEGSLVREILGRVILSAGWAAVVVLLYELGPEFFHRMAIAESAHALIGPALALLLVFRTNSSYDRFWEGRKQWGAIVNESRNLARQAEAWFQADRQFASRFTRWAIAFSYGTMNHLRSEQSIGPAGQTLPDEEVESIHRSGHVPLAVARKLTALMYEARQKGMIDAIQLQSMDQNVQQLVDYCGACERIRNTPAPFGYVVHLRRALIIYCLTLPLALIQRFGWETIPVTLIISYVMFGIEEIGVEIENPFELTINDLQLEALCKTIDANLNGILNSNS